MPLYQYHAFDSRGKKRLGFIEASDEREAKGKLREQGLMITTLSRNAQVTTKQNLSNDALLSFTLQLSQLTNAGVPLYQALSALEEQYRGENYHRVILSLCDQIKGGQLLSAALSSFPQSFDPLYCAMVAAGETAGALDIVLERLAHYLDKKNKIHTQITTAMIYPAILAGFSLLVIALLMGFVVPAIEGIFSGRELNNFTLAVLGVSRFIRSYWWLYMPFTAGAGLLIYRQLRSKSGIEWLQRNLLKVPVISTLLVQTAIARFCRTMGTLQLGGVTMIDSLRMARNVIGNIVLEREIENAENKIIEGSSLSAELINSPFIPKMVSRMLAVGEDSGSTAMMFNKIADNYEGEIEKTIDRTMALIQPLILVVMGFIIGMVVIAILLPMTNFSAFSQP